jgi:hypothetical protein
MVGELMAEIGKPKLSVSVGLLEEACQANGLWRTLGRIKSAGQSAMGFGTSSWRFWKTISSAWCNQHGEMKMAKNKAGGGIDSRVVTKQPVRTGQAAKGINHRYPSSAGMNYGNHATDSTKVMPNPAPKLLAASPVSGGVKLGNQTAMEAGQGPGAGRNVSRTGSQGQHGAPEGRPAPKGRDILSAFGPDSKR